MEPVMAMENGAEPATGKCLFCQIHDPEVNELGESFSRHWTSPHRRS